MPSHFDTEAEDAKLATLREQEEEDLARIMSEKHNIPYTDLGIIPINMDALRVIPEKDAREALIVAFDKSGKHLSVALCEPENDRLVEVAHELETQGFILQKFLMSRRSLELALARYVDLSLAAETKAGVFDMAGEQLEQLSHEVDSLPHLKAFLDASLGEKKIASISHVLEGILEAAFVMNASDVHIEPEDTNVRLRLRLDGVLTDTYFFDAHAYHLIASRIKLLSGLKLNVENRAQDGRFSVMVNGKEIEIRTSLIPGNYGESIVLRILDPRSIQKGFADMGINTKLLERFATEIRRPNGMFLTTGPTGSGKTTTLYAFLREIHTPEIKIVTIEDPIEYHLNGIVQTQTNGKDYTFASGLRSVLRQDPDVIMVGEIRDGEVAETAIQAALTGHFVFSTLHTNNAPGTFPRLVDLGIDPKTIPAAVTVAMGQRLVRTLNPETRVQRAATQEEKDIMQKIFSSLQDPSQMPASFDTVWAPTANGEHDTGYKGRVGVHEAIFMDDALAEMLRTNPTANDIEKETRRQGFLTMAQDGVLKALSGLTSLDEVFKVVDLPRG
jgi:type IV pilus assembly protein PilB